jgi:hypothetical protein
MMTAAAAPNPSPLVNASRLSTMAAIARQNKSAADVMILPVCSMPLPLLLC